jgi:hypothetical protein
MPGQMFADHAYMCINAAVAHAVFMHPSISTPHIMSAFSSINTSIRLCIHTVIIRTYIGVFTDTQSGHMTYQSGL